MQIAKDHPETLKFALQAGKLIQNFGVVELTSYRWIHSLTGSAAATEISMELPLAKRLEIILKLLGRDTTLKTGAREKAMELWKQLKDKGCELRNTIAHGTVGLSFPENDASADPQAIGILKLRKWQDSDQLLSLEELENAVNVTARIAENLNEILDLA
jgi:hypothetical protein